MKELSSLFGRILCCFFALFITSAHSMNPDLPMISFDNKNYPFIDISKISIDSSNSKYDKIIIILPDKTFSKRINKFIDYERGLAFITKKKKIGAAISCFDLALVCQYRRKDFAYQMAIKVCEQNLQQGEILTAYLNRDLEAFKNIVNAAVQDSRILNLITERDLLMPYAESCGKILQGQLGGRALYMHLDCVYGELIEDFNNYKHVNPLYRFALQLESLSAREFEKNWKEGGAAEYKELCKLLDPLTGAQHIMEVLDEFLGKVPMQIIYFFWSHKHSAFQVLPQEIMGHIALSGLPIRLISSLKEDKPSGYRL